MHRTGQGLRAAATAAAVIAAVRIAAAQDIPINYERLSSMEEPLATEIGDITLTLTGLVDLPLTADVEDDELRYAGLIGNFQAGALVQLQNRWRVSLAYFGQYATDSEFSSRPDRRYVDNAALSLGSAWGTLAGGNVVGLVREQTRRKRGAGNGVLELDDALGGLDEWGGGYTVRLGPWVVGAVVDEEADFQLGTTFRRPIDDTDYRLSLWVSDGMYRPAGSMRNFASVAAGAVAEVIYGSTTFDAGLGYERLRSPGVEAERGFLSLGIRGKAGVLGWSAEAHFGRLAGTDETSLALGAHYDVARGLSINLGLNHTSARADAGGERLIDRRDTRLILSVRYGF